MLRAQLTAATEEAEAAGVTATQDAQHVIAARQVQVDKVMAGTHSHNVYTVQQSPSRQQW